MLKKTAVFSLLIVYLKLWYIVPIIGDGKSFQTARRPDFKGVVVAGCAVGVRGATQMLVLIKATDEAFTSLDAINGITYVSDGSKSEMGDLTTTAKALGAPKGWDSAKYNIP